MNQETCNFNWHTYSDHLQDMLHNMRKSENLTDVTLVCDDQKQINAYKVVISACSTVFKTIIDSLPLNSSVIYLRGIKSQEMESILEFMYLGVASFSQERMNEFLTVARDLEIKEISKNVKFNYREEFYDEQDITEALNEQEEASEPDTIVSDQSNSNMNQNDNASSIKSRTTNHNIQDTTTNFCCSYCTNQFSSQKSLSSHIQSKHKGVKYACSQCDQEFAYKGSLTIHIKSKHEGVKYSCNQCDHQFARQDILTLHIKTKHKGVKYACDQCDNQFTQQGSLIIHVQSKHEGVKYTCQYCSKEFTLNRSFRAHSKKCRTWDSVSQFVNSFKSF